MLVRARWLMLVIVRLSLRCNLWRIIVRSVLILVLIRILRGVRMIRPALISRVSLILRRNLMPLIFRRLILPRKMAFLVLIREINLWTNSLTSLKKTKDLLYSKILRWWTKLIRSVNKKKKDVNRKDNKK
jgi:hypothetical protein